MADETNEININYSELKIFKEYNSKDINFPIILSVPHAGTLLPQEFIDNSPCTVEELRSNEDSFVDELVQNASNLGIPMISMNIARAFVDVNRDKIEIDPTMYFDYPSETDDGCGRLCRVGLGVIHRITANNKNIYRGPISYPEVLKRFEHVYDPYHKRLQQLVDKVLRKFGICFVLDCHSMPSKICNLMHEAKEIQFCLGTLFEQSAPKEICETLYQTLTDKGYRVMYDCPYSGAFITFNYCQPRKKVYTLQLEANRDLYMIENKHHKNHNFQKVSTDLCDSIMVLANFLLDFNK